jgi:hypothetical protein
LAVKVSENVLPNTDNFKTDAVIYCADKRLCFYDIKSGQNFTGLLDLGPTVNQIFCYMDRTIVVNSGLNGDSTSVEIILNSAVKNYLADKNLSSLRQSVNKIMLEHGGNAYTACGFNDSLLLVTLAQSKKLQVISMNTGKIKYSVSLTDSNPQGSAALNDTLIAVALSDWGGGTGRSIGFYNTKTGALEKKTEVALNPVDVAKLGNGDVISWTWGAWSGDENYGTISVIDGKTLGLKSSLRLPYGTKADQIVQVNDSLVYVHGFDSEYETVAGFYNLSGNSFSLDTAGFWAKCTIAGKMLDSTLIVKSTSGSSELFSLSGVRYNYTMPFFSKLCQAIRYSKNSVKVDSHQSLPVAECYKLLQNYPNPFNPETIIGFELPKESRIQISVYNILGQKVCVLADEVKKAGKYNVRFNGTGLSSGTYICRIEAGQYSQSIKMLLLK